MNFHIEYCFCLALYIRLIILIKNNASKLLIKLFQEYTLLPTCLIIIAIIEFFLFDKYISNILRTRLNKVGFDKRKNQRVPQYYSLFNLNKLLVFIPIFLNSVFTNKTWLIYLFLFIFLLMYISFIQEKIDKSDIILFYSKVDYDDADESVDLEKDIAIVLIIGEEITVNLTNTKMFIKNNNDILLLFKNHETNIIKRGDILYIKIKDNQLRYVNEQWISGNIIHYSS